MDKLNDAIDGITGTVLMVFMWSLITVGWDFLNLPPLPLLLDGISGRWEMLDDAF